MKEIPEERWVLFKSNPGSRPVRVPIAGCSDIDKFIDAIQAKLSKKLAGVDPDDISLHLTVDSPALDSGDGIPAQNNSKTAWVVKVPTNANDTGSVDSLNAGPCTVKFYNTILKGVEKDGWLSFEDELPHLPTLTRIYVRKSYKTIVDSILLGNKAIITGTPGIGKSLCLLYLLWTLVKQGKRVLLIYHPETIYYDGQGGVFELDLPSFRNRTFWNNDLWCLFDAKHKSPFLLDSIPYPRCKIVLSTSPRREMINDFKKPPLPRFFYMPVWDKTELEAISVCFQDVTDWPRRFDILGGIPRIVFENTSEEPTSILKKACHLCNLDDCIRSVGMYSEITEKVNIIHSLVHTTSSDPYTSPLVSFASKYALELMVAKIRLEAIGKMRSLLSSCDGNPLTAALCGYIFEPHAIELVEKGGEFDCRKLVGGGNKKVKLDKKAAQGGEKAEVELKLNIPPSSTISVDQVEENQKLNYLHVPKSKRYRGIDAWIPGIGGFQMTVAMKHAINVNTGADLAKLGKDANKLYWFLPPQNYDSFIKQGSSDQGFEEYAVRVPFYDDV